MMKTNFSHDRSPGMAEELIDPWNKGLGPMERALPASAIAKLGWQLLREDLSLPAAVLYQDKLLHNLDWMQRFIAEYGVSLAPHGKTTMAPKLFAMQMQAGAWGITLATAHQARIAYEHGVRRVLMANQLVGKQNMSVIAQLLEDPDFEYFCLVDSAEQIEQLGRFFQKRWERKEKRRPLHVLLEVGVKGGRTGVRDPEQVHAVLATLKQWREHVALCGVEIYEGVLDDEKLIREFLRHAISVTREIAREECFARSPIILSGAGSAWYDVVADAFTNPTTGAGAEIGRPVEIVLRPGCYLTHDVGIYRMAQERILQRNPIAQRIHSSLQPALQLWAYVQSVPEKTKAIIALGKRDAAFDAGLPVPALHYRPGNRRPGNPRPDNPRPDDSNDQPVVAPAGWQLIKMMDQHAYLQITEGDDIRVGDMIGFDISHPCLTFDKWRCIAVVDNKYHVVDVVQTFF